MTCAGHVARMFEIRDPEKLKEVVSALRKRWAVVEEKEDKPKGCINEAFK